VVSQFIQYLRIVGMLCGLSTLSVSAQAIYLSKKPVVQVSFAQIAIKTVASVLPENTALSRTVPIL
jgi:fluoride ion exporter CrcB/FEX